MITLKDDCEYTITVADLIETLAKLDEFLVKFWIQSNELPLPFDDGDDFQFLQESIKITKNDAPYDEINYVLYDMISHIQVIGRCNNENE